MSGDLVAFLRARLNEDQRAAEAATPGPWIPRNLGRHDGSAIVVDTGNRTRGMPIGPAIGVMEGPRGAADGVHTARHNPARVLAEVEAKRRQLDEYDQAFTQREELAGTPHSIEGAVRLLTALRFVKLLALPHADHPDYREEWRL